MKNTPKVTSTWASSAFWKRRSKRRYIDESHHRHTQGGYDQGHQEASGALDHCEPEIGTQEINRTMRQVDDPHETEDQRQPCRQQKQQHPKGDAIEVCTIQNSIAPSPPLLPKVPLSVTNLGRFRYSSGGIPRN